MYCCVMSTSTYTSTKMRLSFLAEGFHCPSPNSCMLVTIRGFRLLSYTTICRHTRAQHTHAHTLPPEEGHVKLHWRVPMLLWCRHFKEGFYRNYRFYSSALSRWEQRVQCRAHKAYDAAYFKRRQTSCFLSSTFTPSCGEIDNVCVSVYAQRDWRG